jgi:hypothetical protein
MTTAFIAQINPDVVQLVTEFDPSMAPIPWKDDFVRLKNRIKSPKVYMKDGSAMALCCLLLSQKLSVPLQYIYEPSTKKQMTIRVMAVFICRDVLTWQDQTWISNYFCLSSGYYTSATDYYLSPRQRNIIKEITEKSREALIQIYKSY